MKILPNPNKYLKLRKEFSFFSFEQFQYTINKNYFEIVYEFNLSDKYTFKPTLQFPVRNFYYFDNISQNLLNNLIFHIGMVELISYWKAACPEKIIIKPYSLTNKQIDFWKKIYFNGLGEFFYLNNIKATQTNFADILSVSDKSLQEENMQTDNSVIIPVGGGKDSVVSLELLKNFNTKNLPLILNPRQASSLTSQIAGFEKNNIIEIKRTIHPQLLELNKQGFLNGHTPFSALLAFVSLLAAALTGKKNIALSNESSANEATVENSTVNHQYSKSYEFESDFRTYTENYISKSFNYFSFLRPLNELQIAYMFSKFPVYFPEFKSCNAGSKEDIWCGKCPKCLFAFIILSPFIKRKKMIEIFGKDMLDDKNLMFYFEQLIGVEKVKPFECVGTIDEVNIALNMLMKQIDKDTSPYLMNYYKSLNIYTNYQNDDLNKHLKVYNNQHFLTPEFENILKQNL